MMISPQIATTAAASQVDPALHTVVTTIDQSFHSHVAGTYWAWRHLFDDDSDARIGQHPDYVLAELAQTTEPQHLPPCVVTCQSGNELEALAILVGKSLAGEKKFGPAWNLRGYRLKGNALLGSKDESVRRLLLDAISQHLSSTRADFLLIEDLDELDPLNELVLAESNSLTVFRPQGRQTRHRIQLPSSFDVYLQKFKSKSRYNLRAQVKQMGAARVQRITEPGDVEGFLSAAHEISKNTWQTELLGLRISNDERELAELTCLASLGALRAYLLWLDDRPVSFCFGTQFNGVYYCEEVGYDRTLRDMSPGQVLVFKLLEDLMTVDSPITFDFGGGDAEYKRHFGNSVSSSGHVWLLRPGIRSRMIRVYFAGRSLLSRTLRAVLTRTGLLTRIRRWSRRGTIGS